uniref:V-SNARE coiled-coil homology domain-containing protein n=1 Tax=Arcella intermedia TaxID=1963864 RepID=A0A6B2LIP7_9EUKA
MSIFYALVSRGDVVLAEWTNAQGNFITLTREMLKRLDPFINKRASFFSYDEKFHYHIYVENGLIFLCMADAAYQKRRGHMFLTDLRTSFLNEFGEAWQNAIAFQYNNQFARVIQSKAQYHSDVSSDKIASVQAQIDVAKGVVMENIEKLLERGDRIEILVDKTNQLQDVSFDFKVKAKSMKTRLWCKNIKLMAIIIVLVLVSLNQPSSFLPLIFFS